MNLAADESTFQNIDTRWHEFQDPDSKLNLTDLFGAAHVRYLDEHSLYLYFFKTIPNIIEQDTIDCEKANLWFLDNFDGYIKDWFYSKRCLGDGSDPIFDNIFYILQDDLMMKLDFGADSIKFLFRNTKMPLVQHFIDKFKQFKVRPATKSKISLLVRGTEGIYTKSVELKKPRLNIHYNYNDDFISVNKLICNRLSKNNDKGIVLLHGKPGTGKTSYIRYLVTRTKKKVIFMPPGMAPSITDPDMISVLIKNANSVIVIEDAENIIVDREGGGASPVSALLNISDGLLSDCLNIQIICSFNTDISKVDSALLRKGRLIAKYEFKELEVDKANILSQKLGFDADLSSPMTLAAIYNRQEMEFQYSKRFNSIGFRAINGKDGKIVKE